MSDVWSLKGLKQKQIDYVDKSIDIPYYIYKKVAIDTLREKLIEDIQELRTDLFTGRNWKIVVESIIKKRFGVKDDNEV